MRILSLICGFLVVVAGNAFALKSASQADIDLIAAQLLVAKGLDVQILAAKAKYDLANANVNTSKAELLALDKDVEREKAKQRVEQTKAIHLAIIAYNLAPANLHGTSFMRWTKGRTLAWLPIAGEGEDRQVQNIGGKLMPSNKPKEAYAGVASPDGFGTWWPPTLARRAHRPVLSPRRRAVARITAISVAPERELASSRHHCASLNNQLE